MPKVKICGVTSVEEALSIADRGADFIGLIFATASPRAVERGSAKAIRDALYGKAFVVGVFAEQTEAEIREIADELTLDFVQLHGESAREAYKNLKQEYRCIYALSYRDAMPQEFDCEKDFLLFDGERPHDFVPFNCRYFLAGGLCPKTVGRVIEQYRPYGVDVARGVEIREGKKDLDRVEEFLTVSKMGRFGIFGGAFVPELLIQPLKELVEGFEEIALKEPFQEELKEMLRNYAGRPTPITEIQPINGVRILLKREDLLHTGAHKINNALGQCYLAKKMGRIRVIAETGAGQHGVATATACALLGLECVVYMGEIDADRQAPNISRMELLGATVVRVSSGSKTLKDAVNEALRDWSESFETTHYCIGSALGPHPYPTMVAQFQAIIGIEAKEQVKARIGRDPDYAIACVGGGSNAIGLFSAYLETDTKLIGVEAKGAARFVNKTTGALHGSYSYVLQNTEGQIAKTHSISAGLDYAGVGPQHAFLFAKGRVTYETASDQEALGAFRDLSRKEGIIPALESAHAIAYAFRLAKEVPQGTVLLVNLSGRGDKDLPELFRKGYL